MLNEKNEIDKMSSQNLQKGGKHDITALLAAFSFNYEENFHFYFLMSSALYNKPDALLFNEDVLLNYADAFNHNEYAFFHKANAFYYNVDALNYKANALRCCANAFHHKAYSYKFKADALRYTADALIYYADAYQINSINIFYIALKNKIKSSDKKIVGLTSNIKNITIEINNNNNLN